MKVVINVTAEDIKNGKYQDAIKCVIALALARDLKKYSKVFKFEDFDSASVHLTRKSDDKRFAINVSKKASAFAARFDAIEDLSWDLEGKKLKEKQAKKRAALKPFKFTFDIPDEIFQKVEKQEAVNV